MRRLPFSVRPYRNAKRPKYQWQVVGNLNGKRARKFFESQVEAKTFAHIRNTELVQYGSEATQVPGWLRLMAQRCQNKLAAFQVTIEDATEHFISLLKQRERSCRVEKLFEEIVES